MCLVRSKFFLVLGFLIESIFKFLKALLEGFCLLGSGGLVSLYLLKVGVFLLEGLFELLTFGFNFLQLLPLLAPMHRILNTLCGQFLEFCLKVFNGAVMGFLE